MLFFLTVLSFIGFGAVMAQNGTNPPQGPPEIIDLPPPGTEQGNGRLASGSLPMCVLTPGENGEHGPCSREEAPLAATNETVPPPEEENPDF